MEPVKGLDSRKNSGRAQRYGEVDDERSNRLIGRSESKMVSPEI